jgi:hypothetical protein
MAQPPPPPEPQPQPDFDIIGEALGTLSHQVVNVPNIPVMDLQQEVQALQDTVAQLRQEINQE